MNIDAHTYFLVMILGAILIYGCVKAASLRPSVGAAILPPITPSAQQKPKESSLPND